MTHLLRAVAASLLAGWLLAPAAHADLTWSSTQTLSTDATNGAGPALAFDATGGAVAAWLETDGGGHNRVHVATRAAHGFLGPAATVSAAGTDAYGVRVVVARDGAAYVLWGQQNAATGADIYVLSRPAGGAFGQSQNATETDGTASLGDAVVNNANDRLLMAYSQLDTTTGPPAQVEERVKRVTTAGAVSGFIKIAEVTASDVNHDPLIGQQDLAMDASGNALLVWADNPNSWNQDRDQAYVRAARLDANGNPLEAAQQVGVRVGRSIDDPVAAINNARSVVLWNKTTGAGRGEADYVTRTGTGTGAWSGFKTPISNDYDNDPNFFRSVVSDAAGNLTATYGRGFDAAPANGDLSMDASALYFGATRPFADPADSARLFAVDDSGTSSYYRLDANRHVSIGTRASGPGGAYSSPVDLATLPQQQRPVVAAGPDGTTGVMWVDSDGENDRVFVRFGDIPVPAGPGGSTPGPSGGPPPPPPLPLPPPPPAAPVPSAIQVVQKFTSGHAGVLTVAFTGEARQIEWTVGKNGPTYVATASERSIRLRLTGPATVTAKITGPGGAQTFTRSVSGQPLPDDADAKTVLGGEPRDASTVVATGAESVLTGKSSACGAVNVRSGGVTLSGCMRPLDELADLPGAERGVLDPIASAYGLNRSDAGLMGRAIELLDGYAATGTVLVNGLWPVTPARGAGVMAFPQASALTSSNASVRVAGTALKPAGSGFNLKVGSSAGAIDLGAIPRPASFPQLGRFPYVGDFNVSLGGGYATIQTNIKMPDFVERNGINVQPRIQIYASPDGLSSVDGLKMGPMDVAFGPIGLDDLTVRYDQASDQWIGGMSACLFGAGCLDFKDPVGSIRLQGNELVYAKTGLVFDDPGKPLAPPAVYLNHANLGFGLNPSRVFGQAGISAGGFVKVDGYEVFAAPSSATPYLLKRDEVGESFPAEMYSTPFTRPLVAAGGDVGLDLPFIGYTRLGGGYFVYELPGYVAMGGNASFNLLGIIRFGGGINGEMRPCQAALQPARRHLGLPDRRRRRSLREIGGEHLPRPEPRGRLGRVPAARPGQRRRRRAVGAPGQAVHLADRRLQVVAVQDRRPRGTGHGRAGGGHDRADGRDRPGDSARRVRRVAAGEGDGTQRRDAGHQRGPLRVLAGRQDPHPALRQRRCALYDRWTAGRRGRRMEDRAAAGLGDDRRHLDRQEPGRCQGLRARYPWSRGPARPDLRRPPSPGTAGAVLRRRPARRAQADRHHAGRPRLDHLHAGPGQGKAHGGRVDRAERHRLRGAHGHDLHPAAAGAGGAAWRRGPAQGHLGAGDLARRARRDRLRAGADRRHAALRHLRLARAGLQERAQDDRRPRDRPRGRQLPPVEGHARVVQAAGPEEAAAEVAKEVLGAQEARPLSLAVGA